MFEFSVEINLVNSEDMKRLSKRFKSSRQKEETAFYNIYTFYFSVNYRVLVEC